MGDGFCWNFARKQFCCSWSGFVGSKSERHLDLRCVVEIAARWRETAIAWYGRWAKGKLRGPARLVDRFSVLFRQWWVVCPMLVAVLSCFFFFFFFRLGGSGGFV